MWYTTRCSQLIYILHFDQLKKYQNYSILNLRIFQQSILWLLQIFHRYEINFYSHSCQKIKN
jgi:hypothetical protein